MKVYGEVQSELVGGSVRLALKYGRLQFQMYVPTTKQWVSLGPSPDVEKALIKEFLNESKPKENPDNGKCGNKREVGQENNQSEETTTQPGTDSEEHGAST